MTDRDRLIELIEKTFAEQYEKRGLLTAPHTADDLLANGVIVPIRCKECKFYKHTEIGDWMACVRQTAYKHPNDFCSMAKECEQDDRE